jgi:hypothetical protein
MPSLTEWLDGVRGVGGKNQYKTQPKQPDYRFTVEKGEEKVDLAIWQGVSERTGQPYITYSFSQPRPRTVARAPDPPLGPTESAAPVPEDSIPF